MKTQIKIFLVDDNKSCLLFYKKGLMNLGYNNIETFESGESCLENLHQKPDIIFLDHEMGNLNGYEVLKKIKRENPDIFITMISNQSNMQLAINSLKIGALDYILKSDKVINKISNVLNKIEEIKLESQTKRKNFFRKLLSIF